MKRVALAALLVLAACGDARSSSQTDSPGSFAPPDTAAEAESAVDGPVIRYPQPSSSLEGMAALVEGVLELDGGCLYIARDDVSAERFPVLWPAGTRWDDAAQSVVSLIGATMPVGGRVEGGGGFLYVADVERLAGPAASAIAARCVDNTYGEIAVVNNNAAAIAPAA